MGSGFKTQAKDRLFNTIFGFKKEKKKRKVGNSK